MSKATARPSTSHSSSTLDVSKLEPSMQLAYRFGRFIKEFYPLLELDPRNPASVDKCGGYSLLEDANYYGDKLLDKDSITKLFPFSEKLYRLYLQGMASTSPLSVEEGVVKLLTHHIGEVADAYYWGMDMARDGVSNDCVEVKKQVLNGKVQWVFVAKGYAGYKGYWEKAAFRMAVADVQTAYNEIVSIGKNPLEAHIRVGFTTKRVTWSFSDVKV